MGRSSNELRRTINEVALAVSILAIVATCSVVAASRRPAEFVPVLLYHDLSANSDSVLSKNGMTLTVSEFESEISALKSRGYHTITSDDLYSWLCRKKELPARPVLITFDDGYESIYTCAYPILRKYGFRATLFLLGSTVNTKDHLTWDQIDEMVKSSTVEIGNHTYAGHGGTGRNAEYLSWTLDQALSDFQEFQRLCKEHGIRTSKSFAYPFGAFNATIDRAVSQSGYVMAFTTQPGVVRRGDDLLHLKRITVWPGNPGTRLLSKVRLSFWLTTGEDNDVILPSDLQ